ncbi:prepilin-type N-terminal cleavage/methylation domain-containing protein [Vibrio sp. ZSDE26]|uniref:Prepilin-type N-terminal cleavage/methylation domain-containing protein n=1 Tax=Vibrio amylolyticus TaxID=2847292 RepID=A0A9X1XMU3_9VIBR|nr:prepilin-type N-terminal cleavage/methylation domain-containing protein [Vibrio amylolyticus]MCK6262344.1 prepilin-type N-terminal cleavage/methylation domain-containing protein [Vibrio amylolyticus]
MKAINKKQKGFTLIELMIVVAIIGVLSAIAVPAYKDYVSKSELASGFATLKSVITPAELYIQEHGALSGSDTSILGVKTTANNLGALKIENDGSITFTHNKGAVDKTVFTYTRSATDGWTCGVLLTPSTLTEPKGCVKTN